MPQEAKLTRCVASATRLPAAADGSAQDFQPCGEWANDSDEDPSAVRRDKRVAHGNAVGK